MSFALLLGFIAFLIGVWFAQENSGLPKMQNVVNRLTFWGSDMYRSLNGRKIPIPPPPPPRKVD